MTTVMDIPAELGTYMLKGWILTDTVCSQCRKVPLLRSPSAAKNPVPPFCVNCNPNLLSETSGAGASSFKSSKTASRSQSSASTSDVASRSTAPTEVSSPHGSPELIPVDTPESIRRRQQSDTAASEIGKRLLKGWAMLADECPSPDCYGVPLVRPPKTGGEKDPRKECVICGTVYVDETDADGTASLAPLIVVGRREPLTQDSRQTMLPLIPLSDAVSSGTRMFHRPTPKHVFPPADLQFGFGTQHQQVHSSPSDHAISTLEITLQSLTDRLQLFSSPATLDIAIVGQTAEAISKVSHALLSLKELERAGIHS